MKKVKVILSAIAVFAVVGGALAFKAVRSTQTLYQSVGGGCPAIQGFQTTFIDNVATQSLFTTNNDDDGSPCPGVSTTAYQNAN